MLYIVAAVIAGLTAIYLGVFLYAYIDVLRGLRFYEKQGASIVPGASRLIVGNLPDLLKIG